MKVELNSFEIPDIDSWKSQILNESNNQQTLNYIDEIENLNIDIANKINKYTFHTSCNTGKENDWDIVSYFEISNTFQTNKELIKALEHGSNHLYLNITSSNPPWHQIFENIVLDFIQISIRFRNKNQLKSFKSFISNGNEHNFNIVIDPIDNDYVNSFKESWIIWKR